MKRFFKIFLPVILAITILLCTAWYLLVYDHEFTQDVLLYCANYFEDQGQHKIASWLYDLSYEQTDNHDDIAARLAEKYIANGNYTKAEHTLFRAISEGGGKDLYVALCKVFLTQDKLLDAVELLDNISDPTLKSQLDAMRPAAPVLSPTPGFYNQRITVTAPMADVTYYISADGEYPSLTEDLYTGPIATEAGENVIFALAVDSNGLVSPLTVSTYTIVGLVEKVTLTDPAIEAEIRKLINAPASQILYTNDLWQIKEFTVPTEVKSLDDLKYLTNLETLTINHDVSGMLGSIASLPKLSKLSVTGSTVSVGELAVIGSMENLTSLTLENCNLSSLQGLENARNLQYLNLRYNAIRNLNPISGCLNLQELYLSNNALDSLEALAGLVALRKLDIANNAIDSLEPIAALTELTELLAQHNAITDVSYIGGFSKLTVLDVSYNDLTSISDLAKNILLTDLNISNNTISSITELSTLVNLQVFRFANNQATKLPSWPTDCALITLDGAYNNISSVAPLKGLEQLNTVNLDYNKSLSSLSGLEECHNLIMVSVFGTKVRNANALLQQSVIVYYNPA